MALSRGFVRVKSFLEGTTINLGERLQSCATSPRRKEMKNERKALGLPLRLTLVSTVEIQGDRIIAEEGTLLRGADWVEPRSNSC